MPIKAIARLKETAAWPEDFFTLLARQKKPVFFKESSSTTLRGQYIYLGKDVEHKGTVLMILNRRLGDSAKLYRLTPDKDSSQDKEFLEAVIATVKATAKVHKIKFLKKGWLDIHDPKVAVTILRGTINILYSGSDYHNK